jgi:hypothetical protein
MTEPSNAPAVWNGAYQAKAVELAKAIRSLRHVNFEESYREKLLLADALIQAIEECAKVAEAQAQTFLSPQYASNQPFGSLCERFACEKVAKAIRAMALTSS